MLYVFDRFVRFFPICPFPGSCQAIFDYSGTVQGLFRDWSGIGIDPQSSLKKGITLSLVERKVVAGLSYYKKISKSSMGLDHILLPCNASLLSKCLHGTGVYNFLRLRTLFGGNMKSNNIDKNGLYTGN